MNRGSFIFAAAMAVSLALIALFSPQLQPKRDALWATAMYRSVKAALVAMGVR
ncbi:MAG: hypothetical protein IPH48_17685 [bacterium]|nr:hypothetical protein [bacterium]